MRNNLHRLAEVITAAFLRQHGFIDLAAGHVVGPGENAICETLVVPEIEIGLGAIVQNVDFAVLKRVHRARIDIEIRVEFLQDDLKSAVFQQRAERSGS